MLHYEKGDRSTLLDVIRQVRYRWRVKLALRGAVGFLAATIVALIASAYALEALRFSAGAILAFRVTLLLVAVAGAAWFLIRPLLRKVSDEQVALYLEEHEPSLEATIITAMEAERAGGTHEMSPALVQKLVEAAIERVHEIEDGRRIEKANLRRYATTAAVVALTTVALFTLGPAYLRHALSALLVISRGVEAAAPYRIDVTPGTVTLPKGADLTITARLSGFDAPDAMVFTRKSSTEAFQQVPMVRVDNGDYDGLLFDLAESLEYYVEASGVRSATYTLTVVELPYVKQLNLEYHFPAYTGLEPRTVEDGGDVAALSGTEVRRDVQPTMATGSGRIVLNDGSSLPLTPNPDGTLAGRFTATENGFYKIELDGPAGEKVAASPQYAIDILADQAPSVTLSRPGRDSDATPVQEFAVEARADDDFAVRNLQLIYSVNGGPEKAISLFSGSKPTPEVTAGHTFYLEELGVEPGDAVSYYARAMDNDATTGPKTATSDIYFLRIRPFGKDFRPAQSMGGGGGGGAGGEVGALSQQQRQIIAGTFKVQRDRRTMGAGKVKEALVVLALSQSRLREQVQGLVDRMNSRLVTPDPAFQKIAELLPLAAAEMKTAEAKLQAQSAEQALPPENKALQYLQQAEEEYELQVQTQRNAGGGGGGGAGSIADDLAELFKLEMDKMANQYETNQRAMQQNADQQIDELAEKLKELARRQEQELQRQRQAAGQSARDSRGGELQRQLAQQAEEAARQLERLSREQNRPDLQQAARQMQQAADAMRRAAASGDPSAAGQAAAAADRLRQVQRQLQGQQGQRAERDIKDAQRQAEELARENRAITNELKSLPGAAGERQQRVQKLSERKAELTKRVAGLEGQLDKTAAEIVREAREASRRVQEAAGQIRDDKIKEKLNYSRQVMGSDNPQLQEFQRNLEEQLDANFEALERKLAEAASAIGPSGRDRNAEALERTRDLARGIDSLGRRMQESAEQAGSTPQDSGQQNQGQQGQQGQQGEQGQQGQQGQQGPGGQQGGGNQEGRMGGGDTTGGYRDGAGGWGSRRPNGEFNPEDVRQFRDEARRFVAEGRQLRDFFRQQNLDARELEEILRKLRELEDSRSYKDVNELLALQSFVSEGIKRVEYTLRRKLGEETDRALVTGADEVPQEFRKLVEEYYRSLSRGRQQ